MLPRRFRRLRLLIVGCGDVGMRVAAALRGRVHMIGTTTDPSRCDTLRQVGVVPLVANLDDPASLGRLGPFGQRVLHLAPPTPAGQRDLRSAALVTALRRHCTPLAPILASRSFAPRRWVYISTTGVYGDRQGARIDETALPLPGSERALRRLDAERQWRAAGACGAARCSILRVPGIYDAHARSPRARLERGTPALVPADDVFTNHIHADDLARTCALTVLGRGRAQRIVNACDDSELLMGDYFDLAARALGLPTPPRISRADAEAGSVSSMQLSFMRESRRLTNARLKRELRVDLRYPTPAAAFASVVPGDKDTALQSPSISALVSPATPPSNAA